ncbi:hypothetical protein A3SI_16560 [Nitritalea halalkaliphila LW7]|uniref:TonB-dependent receptor n=1 Tax=Nitritalea halalkaliphila LW7 TaxID=1189621 RepID=I5BX20_9BACT|nr:hypothetical protein A3SI_16560 [Nitritalea halalkaliphila LW7]
MRSLRQDLFYQSDASLSLKFLPKNKLKVSLVSKLFSPLNQNNFWNNHFLEARAAYVINDRQNVGLNFKNMTNRRNFESIILSPTNRIMTMVELQPCVYLFFLFFPFFNLMVLTYWYWFFPFLRYWFHYFCI